MALMTFQAAFGRIQWKEKMKIGEFSQQSGISVRMLRFYETAGLLVPRRTAQGWRDYDAADIGFIRKAALLNRAGVPLKDLALMRDCLRDEPQDFCADLRARLVATRAGLATEIVRLQQSERLLAGLLGEDKAA